MIARMRRIAIPAALVVTGCTNAAPDPAPAPVQPPADGTTFTDPAPPAVAELPPMDAPEPQPYPELTFHAAPRQLADEAVTEDWPTFLGPQRNSHSRETHLLKDFSKGGPSLVWTMKCGEGYACPAIQDEYVVYTHREGARSHIDCVHAETGRRFWRVSYPCDYRGDYIPDNGPRATPVIDGDRVYVHGVEGVLHCLELATGRVIWKRDMSHEFEIGDQFFGVVASPLVHGNLLIQNIGAPDGPCVAAFDKMTGRLVWGSGNRWGPGCASPVIAEAAGEQRLFVVTGGKSRPPTGGLMILDPDTGELEFEYPFRSRTYESVNGASPVVGDDRVFITAAYSTGTAALAPNADGEYEQLWKTRHIGMEFSNPVYHEGHLYAVDGRSDRMGAVVCLDPATGKELARTDIGWDEVVYFRGEDKEVQLSIGQGSLMIVEGLGLCLGDNGHLLWLRLSPSGAEVLGRVSLHRGNQTWAPAVLSRGLLYVCQNRRERFGRDPAPPRLMCFDLRGQGSGP
jgi:outer membrane protein assembly factor BamB